MTKGTRTPEEKINIELMAKAEEQQNLGIAQPLPPPTPASVLPMVESDNQIPLQNEIAALKKELALEQEAFNDSESSLKEVEALRDNIKRQKDLVDIELSLAKTLLQECYNALNTVVRKKIYSEKYNDTYELAAALSQFLKK